MGAINPITIIIAGLIHFAIGMIWYSPMFFGKMWLELSGVKEMKLGLGVLLLGIIGSLVTAFVLGCVVAFSGAQTPLDGVIIGTLMEIGFIATLLLGDMLFEKRPFKLFVLRNAYNLVALGVTGSIIAVWR